MKKTLTVYTDGGTRVSNPGPSAIGVYLPEHNKSFGKFVGTRTNNETEYLALIEALEYAIAEGYEAVRVFSDSEFMVKQMKGIYQVKSDSIRTFYLKALSLAEQIDFEITHVKRDKNTEADAEVNRQLDGRERLKAPRQLDLWERPQ